MRENKPVTLAALAMLVISAALLSGCAGGYAHGSFKQVNEQSVPMAGITNLEIDFDVRDITLLSGEGDTLEVRDYMAKDNKDDYSTVTVSGCTVTVSAMQEAMRGEIGETAKVEIIVPESFKGALSMTLTSGEVYAETDLTDYENISLDLQNGQINLQNMEAETISLDAAKGTIRAENIKGKASINVQSGTIDVLMNELTDDLTLNAESGTLRLTLPHDTAFHLNAKTESGTVLVTGADDKVHVSGEVVSKVIGELPEHTITAGTVSGTVEIFMN